MHTPGISNQTEVCRIVHGLDHQRGPELLLNLCWWVKLVEMCGDLRGSPWSFLGRLRVRHDKHKMRTKTVQGTTNIIPTSRVALELFRTATESDT